MDPLHLQLPQHEQISMLGHSLSAVLGGVLLTLRSSWLSRITRPTWLLQQQRTDCSFDPGLSLRIFINSANSLRDAPSKWSENADDADAQIGVVQGLFAVACIAAAHVQDEVSREGLFVWAMDLLTNFSQLGLECIEWVQTQLNDCTFTTDQKSLLLSRLMGDFD